MIFHIYLNKIFLIRAQKFPEQGQAQQICRPNTWVQGVHDIRPKKGRHLSAEVLNIHSAAAHCTVSVPINHTQSDINLCGKDSSGNKSIILSIDISKN